MNRSLSFEVAMLFILFSSSLSLSPKIWELMFYLSFGMAAPLVWMQPHITILFIHCMLSRPCFLFTVCFLCLVFFPFLRYFRFSILNKPFPIASYGFCLGQGFLLPLVFIVIIFVLILRCIFSLFLTFFISKRYIKFVFGEGLK